MSGEDQPRKFSDLMDSYKKRNEYRQSASDPMGLSTRHNDYRDKRTIDSFDVIEERKAEGRQPEEPSPLQSKQKSQKPRQPPSQQPRQQSRHQSQLPREYPSHMQAQEQKQQIFEATDEEDRGVGGGEGNRGGGAPPVTDDYPRQACGPRQRCTVGVVIAVLMGLALALGILVSTKKPMNSNIALVDPNMTTSPKIDVNDFAPTPTPPIVPTPNQVVRPDSDRYDQILAALTSKRLAQPFPNTPQQEALNWIVQDDVLKINPMDPFLYMRYVLAVIYFSCTTEWTASKKKAWMANATRNECAWGGVTCDATTNRFITKLDLSKQNLTNSLPTELGVLTTLEELRLDGNKLNGIVPESFGNLINLKSLELQENNLAGPIPRTIGQMTKLTKLYLEKNNLVGTIPTQISSLASLEKLDLFENNLYGSLPTELGLLTNVNSLGLWNNSFMGFIPTQIGNLKKMKRLYLENNLLIGVIPTQIGFLTNIQDVRLHGNRITGQIPTEIGNLVNVKYVYIDDNTMTGTLPKELGKMTNIVELSIGGGNMIKGQIPDQIGNLEKLSLLKLDNMAITGSIPIAIRKLTQLKILRLNHNKLGGSIPDLSLCKNLNDIRFDNNGLTGSLGDWVLKFPNLAKITITKNNIAGSVPAALCSRNPRPWIETDCAVSCTCCSNRNCR